MSLWKLTVPDIENWPIILRIPLVKPFVITSSNGRIINVYGDNASTDNDDLIMEKVLESDKDLRDLLKKSDLAIFDRGFKECFSRLKSAYGLNCKIPTCKYLLIISKIDQRYNKPMHR
ncbi:unnamed protein product [Brachionus calyciflorus]|uniref:Uncharacterized protein n=1 Tax=Brachionus calyciflorus TaxID=104777 RepID=A0A814MY34_9BILA|nr:unnamed protein product [Brachionus calyciflorus]